MKIKELIETLNKAAECGFEDCDICIVLHNTAHQIADIRVPIDKDHRMIAMFRERKPSYFLNSSNYWSST